MDVMSRSDVVAHINNLQEMFDAEFFRLHNKKIDPFQGLKLKRQSKKGNPKVKRKKNGNYFV